MSGWFDQEGKKNGPSRGKCELSHLTLATFNEQFAPGS